MMKSCALCGLHPCQKRCSRCRTVYYCTREHQAAHWKVHKKTCGQQEPQQTQTKPPPAPATTATAATKVASSQPPPAVVAPPQGVPDVAKLRMFDKPVAVVVIGMAGSGKTTLMQRLNTHVHERAQPAYLMNLDPAVSHVPYSPNIDIRDTANYKEIMEQYELGPNGGIVTALNLFATKFDQAMGFVERRAESLEYVLVDTPGQIEVFNWSASGQIILESLANVFPTVIVYVVDTARTTSPATFMSNMLYACSIMYKAKLPFFIAFNKTDVVSHEFAVEWMTDGDAFLEALRSDTTYMSTLSKSMSLVLEEFYSTIRVVGCSALSGQGIDALFAAVEEGRKEFLADYRPALVARIQELKDKEEERKRASWERYQADVEAARTQVPDEVLTNDATGNNDDGDGAAAAGGGGDDSDDPDAAEQLAAFLKRIDGDANR